MPGRSCPWRRAYRYTMRCHDGMWQGSPMATTRLQYRGIIKHKLWHPHGGFGTLCPRWTHQAASQGFAGDPYRHPWRKTEAHAMLAESIPHRGRRYATRRGIAFVALDSGDGTWHGYPVPWTEVPDKVRNALVNGGT